MVKKVLKFGGTSVGSINRIQHVASIIKKEHDKGNQIIAIVSAMAGKTNELVKLSKNVSENFNKRELDVLLSSGEQVTCALLAASLIKLEVNAKSWLNWHRFGPDHRYSLIKTIESSFFLRLRQPGEAGV